MCFKSSWWSFVLFWGYEMGRSEINREESMKFLDAVAEMHMGRKCRFSVQFLE